MSASEADDAPSELVYCAHAGEEMSVCALEASGRDHFKDLFLKVGMYRSALSAAMALNDKDKMRTYNSILIAGARELLAPSAPAEYQMGMKATLDLSLKLRQVLGPP